MTQINDAAEVVQKKTSSRKKNTSAQKQAGTPGEIPVVPAAEAVVQKIDTVPAIRKEFKPEDYVTVRNGFNGKLVYRSRNTNEVFIWDGLGAEQEMELRELKHARNASRAYFANNWFMFDDPAVPDWLGVGMYYKTALAVDEIDALFEMSPAEIENTLRTLPAGQKETIANRAKELVRAGEKIDSVRVIHALERGLGITLSIAPSGR